MVGEFSLGNLVGVGESSSPGNPSESGGGGGVKISCPPSRGDG